MIGILAGIVITSSIGDALAAIWWRDREGLSEWEFASVGDSAVFYFRPARGSGVVTKRVWLRVEYREPLQGAPEPHSAISLDEINCDTGQTRTVQLTTYESPNLKGKSSTAHQPHSGWSYAVPGTVADGIVRAVCDRAP